LLRSIAPGDSISIRPASGDPGSSNSSKAAGAELRYLPPHSPDLNPIEQVLFQAEGPASRKIAERTVAGLPIALDACADIFKPAECVNYFRDLRI
jgi:transposase